LFLRAIRKGAEKGDRYYAALHLPEVLGARARPHLSELMRREPGTFDNEVVRRAIEACGEE
jgi:hypothetical protein